MRTPRTDVLIRGSGGAGPFAALHARASGGIARAAV